MNFTCPNCGKVQSPSNMSYYLGGRYENHIFCNSHMCQHTLIFFTDFWPDADDWFEHTIQWYRSNPFTTQIGDTNEYK